MIENIAGSGRFARAFWRAAIVAMVGRFLSWLVEVVIDCIPEIFAPCWYISVS